MAQMEWNKYPDVLPPADDIYLAACEYEIDGKVNRFVQAIAFAHDLSEVAPRSFKDAHHRGWYDTFVDFQNECFDYFEIMDVIYWMPFPEPPKD